MASAHPRWIASSFGGQSKQSAGFAVRRSGAVIGVVNLRVAAGRVADVWIVMNPEKLGVWRTEPSR